MNPKTRGSGWRRSLGALSLAALLAAPSTRLSAATGPQSGAISPILNPALAAPLAKRERPVVGVEAAKILVIEIASFKCTHCRNFHEKIFPVLRTQYVDTGMVQWTVLNASDDPSDQFARIFGIARCALRQGKYWELLDSLFQVAHRPPSFLEDLVAKSPLIDRSELDICLRDRTIRTDVAADFAEYAELKVRGTPTFLIRKLGPNGERTEAIIAGAQTLEYFQRALDALVKSP